MLKKEKIKISVLVLASFLIFIILFSISNSLKKENLPLFSSTQAMPIVNFSTENPTTIKTFLEVGEKKYNTEIIDQLSVYDFMKKLQAEGKINFKEKNYLGMGKFIEEINGVRGDGTKYWIYYVNGKKANIGVSNYKIIPGDVVSWKYEKDY